MRRVVVTGVGVVSPLGESASLTWEHAIQGKSGIDKITHFDASTFPVTFAGEVRGVDFSAPFAELKPRGADSETKLFQVAHPKDLKRFGRFTLLGLKAGIEAYRDSGLDSYRDKVSPERMGVNIGVGMGGLPEIEAVHRDLMEKGHKRVTPFFIPQSIPNLISGQLSILLNLKGPNLCNVTACSSSAHSVGESMRLIKRGEADVMVAGGAEAVICAMGIAGFASMRALSTRNDSPQTASRPFDRDRDGFVMGEGSAVLVLEDYEFAKKRGAKIYAEVKGYGATGDAYHITSPAPEGEGGRRAMELSVKDAGLNPDQVDYINAHGTSTPAGDVEEAIAISRVFANRSKDQGKLMVSSTKSMTGHLLGAAGAIEAFFCIKALETGIIPPTINLENLDPGAAALPIDYVANKAKEKRINAAVSNSFGFGGTNASLLFTRI